MEIFIITRISFYYEFKLHWWKWHHFETASFETDDDCCRWKCTIWLNHETALHHVCMLIYFMSHCKPLNRVQQSTVLSHWGHFWLTFPRCSFWYHAQVHLWSQENKAHSMLKSHDDYSSFWNYTLKSQSCFWAFFFLLLRNKCKLCTHFSWQGDMSVAFSRHNTHRVLERSQLSHDDP